MTAASTHACTMHPLNRMSASEIANANANVSTAAQWSSMLMSDDGENAPGCKCMTSAAVSFIAMAKQKLLSAAPLLELRVASVCGADLTTEEHARRFPCHLRDAFPHVHPHPAHMVPSLSLVLQISKVQSKHTVVSRTCGRRSDLQTTCWSPLMSRSASVEGSILMSAKQHICKACC